MFVENLKSMLFSSSKLDPQLHFTSYLESSQWVQISHMRIVHT